MNGKIWTPGDDPWAEITMELEIAKFSKQQVESRADQLKTTLATMSGHIKELERNLDYLSLHKGIVSLPEYRIVRSTLAALKAERKHMLATLAEIEASMGTIQKEIAKLESIPKIELARILKFRKRHE